MLRKATRRQTRDHNSRLVLRTVYQLGPISRADIARATRLTRPTVSSIVSGLLEEDLVVEAGLGPSAGGKPPTLLELVPHAREILCVDIGSSAFRAARVNLAGEIQAQTTLPAENRQGEAALALLFELIEELLAQVQAPLLGIAVGTPGFIDPVAGLVREAVNLAWHDLPLRDRLEARFEHPIYLANDSQAAALAEFTFGEPHPSPHLLLIKVGQGVGAGIVIDEQPFYGDGAGAGEIGQVVVEEAGSEPPRRLEMVLGTRALLEQAEATKGRPVAWEELAAAVRDGEPALSAITTRAAHFLGLAVANLIAAYNIENIIIAGRVAQFGEPFLKQVHETAYRHALPVMVADTTITYASLGPEIVLLGCAALVLKRELGII